MINKVSTVVGFMFLAALILLAALNLDAVAAPPEKPVTVTNTPADPVPTVDVENPAKQPFHAGRGVDGIIDQLGAVITTVPPGKRLVIETITSSSRINLTGAALQPALSLTVNGNAIIHYIGLSPNGQDATRSFWLATHAVRLYADPSTDVKVHCGASIPGSQFCTITISGYLVDVP